MKVNATELYTIAAHHFGKRAAEAALYGRRLGETRPPVGFPQGRPGPGGGIFIERMEQAAIYLLGLAASPTAGDAPAAVRAYADLPPTIRSHGGPVNAAWWESALLSYRLRAEPHSAGLVERERRALARLQDFEEPPDLFVRLRSEEVPSLLEALTALLDMARTEHGRRRLHGTLLVTVRRTRREALITVDDPLSGERFTVGYGGGEAGDDLARPDVDYAAVFTDRLIRDFGEALGAADAATAELSPEREGAPPTEASGAPSVSRRRANAGTRSGCEPRANADSPAVTSRECIAVGTRIPPVQAGGSHPPSRPRRRGTRCPTAASPCLS